MKFERNLKRNFTVVTLFLSSYVNSQSLQQVYHFGTNNAESVHTIATDKSGNLYTGVNFRDQNLFLNGSLFAYYYSASNCDEMCLAKFNPQGNLLWKFVVEGDDCDYLYDIQTDAANNVYIAGITRSDFLQLDNNIVIGPPTQFYGGGVQDIFIAKYDSNGVFQWALPISNSEDEYIYDFTVDSAGNSYISGSLNTYTFFTQDWTNYDTLSGSKDIFFAKYDTNGDLDYLRKLDVNPGATVTLHNRINGMDVDNNGNLYLLGKYRDSIDCDPSPNTYMLPNDLPNENSFIAKYNATGNLVWAYMFECVTSIPTYVHDIAIDNSLGALYITGRLLGAGNNNDFDLTSGVTVPNPSSGNMFLAQYDLNAALFWVESFATSGGGGVGTNDEFMSIEVSPGNGVYVGGNFVFTSDFNPIPGQTNALTCNGTLSDYYVAKYSPSGLFEWVTGSGGTDADYTTCLATDKNSGILYAGGVFQQTIDFNPPSSSFTYTSLGVKDAFVLKFSDTTLTSINDENGFVDNKSFFVFPNPASNYIHVASDLNHTYHTQELFKLTTIEGQTVFAKQVDKRNMLIDIQEIKQGIYIYEIITNNNITKGKLIKR